MSILFFISQIDIDIGLVWIDLIILQL